MTYKELIHTTNLKSRKTSVIGVNGKAYSVACIKLTLEDQLNNKFVYTLDQTTAYRLYKQIKTELKLNTK